MEESILGKESKYNKLMKFFNNYYCKLIITGGSVFIAYLFYLLGYSFIYGYYFGGSIEGIINPLDVLISQIPFDIRYISVLGIIIFVLTSNIFLLMYKIIFNRSILKFLYLLFYTCVVFLILFVLNSFNIKIPVQLYIKLVESSILFFVSISLVKHYSRILNSRSIILNLLVCTAYFIAYFIFDYKIYQANKELNKMLLKLLLLILIIIEEYIFEILYSNVEIKHIKLICFILIVGASINIKILLLILIMIVILSLISNNKMTHKNDTNNEKNELINLKETGIKNKLKQMVCFFSKHVHVIIIKLKVIFINEKLLKFNRTIREENIKDLEKEVKGKLFLFIPLSVLLIISLIIYMSLFCIISSIGNQLGKEIALNKFNEITYYTINKVEPTVLEGIIVKQYENTYYISTKERELKIISSSNVIITPIKK